MTYGLIAKNTHGVVISADLKNYMFSGYTAAPTPSAGLYVFIVTANAASIYGIRLSIGGKGSVVSAVPLGGGSTRVTVLGSGVIGLLVFSPITGGGNSGYGMSLFDGNGQCTFDSAQKPLVVGAAGVITPGGAALVAAGDTAIYIGAGIYPSSSVSQSNVQVPALPQNSTGFVVSRGVQYARAVLERTTTVWDVKRTVALRTLNGFAGELMVHESGSYTTAGSWKKYQSPIYATARTPTLSLVGAWSASLLAVPEFYYAFATLVDYAATAAGRLTASNTYPYTQASYNTTQNSILVTDSSLYL